MILYSIDNQFILNEAILSLFLRKEGAIFRFN